MDFETATTAMSTNNSTGECPLLLLNNDCLLEIYKYLRVIDWCSLRETCTRLCSIADYCFEKQQDTFELNGRGIRKDGYEEISMNDAAAVFRNFGHQISKLTINTSVFSHSDDFDKLIPLLDRYCHSLKDLKLVKIKIDAETIKQCGRILSNLERLVIDKFKDENAALATCLAHCNSLKEFEMIRMYNIEGNSLVRCHPNLESFSVKSCDNMSYEFVQAFMTANPQLKQFKFIGYNCITDQLFQQIAVTLPNLEALSLSLLFVGNSVNENLLHLLQLTKIKKLEINCGCIAIIPLLNGLVANNLIESLHLSNFEISNNSIQALCNIKTLRVLKLSSTKLSKENCKALASSLPVLSEIHIIQCSTVSFNELIEFIDNSITLSKLVFIRFDDTPSLTEAQFMTLVESRQKNVNKEILKVYLDSSDRQEIEDEFKWSGNSGVIRDHADVIKLLLLEEEADKMAIYDFGVIKQREFKSVESDDDFDDDFGGFDDGYDEMDEDFMY